VPRPSALPGRHAVPHQQGHPAPARSVPRPPTRGKSRRCPSIPGLHRAIRTLLETPRACRRSRSSDRWCCSRGVLPRARVPTANSVAATRCHAPADRPGQLLCCPPFPRFPAFPRCVVAPGRHARFAARGLPGSRRNRHRRSHQHRYRGVTACPGGGAGSHRFAPSSAVHRPRLAGAAVWGWVSDCGSRRPPLDADGDWRRTGEHLSP
jgi:hypothetical protein